MIKRTNKIMALIMCTTTITTLGTSINAFASDALEGKDGDFSNAFAYSNKYLYDGYRGTDGNEKTVYYSNGKYNELVNTFVVDNPIKYDNKYIELDNKGDENLFNLQTGQFEGDSAEDREGDIKRDLIKKLKETKRYGSDVGNYINLDKRISTNKSSFEDVWYQYSVDYNGQDVKYVTTIDVAAQSNDDWDNITLKKGNGIDSSFGDSYQFWFSVTTNDAANKETDNQPKTYNGDVEAASKYVAGRITDYCGYDAEVTRINGRWVIQVISNEKLDGDVITGHNNDISVSTKEVPSSHIKYLKNEGKNYVTTSAAVTVEQSTPAAVTLEQSTPAASSFTIDYTKDPVYYGVVNNEGKYMDISKLANIKLGYKINSKTKTVSIDEFGKAYGDEDIVANLTDIGTDILVQDPNYIYVSANVEFTSDKVEFKTGTDNEIIAPDSGNSKEYILKISKAVGEKSEGAYTPKEVTAYEMDGESDFKSWIQAKCTDDWYNLDLYAKDGELYIVRFNKGGVDKKNEVQASQIKFENKRDDNYKISRNVITKVCDSSISTRMKGSQIVTTNADEIRNVIKPYYSIDSEGNLWVLGLKKIYEFNGSGFDEKYTVPGMISNLDVYNKENLVAWGNNGSDYNYVTNIKEDTDNSNKISAADTNSNDASNSSNNVSKDNVENKTGWIQTKAGWQFFDESGKQVKNSWVKVNEKWYLIDEDGIMKTGWVKISGKWYYLNSNGSMATGWTSIENKYYYLNLDGTMATGWANIDGDWYYLRDSGEMSIGWICDAGNWYHLGTDGIMRTGWIKYGKHWYYLDESGKMLSDTTVNGYSVGSDGALI